MSLNIRVEDVPSHQRVTCDAHMLSGRPATHAITVQGVSMLAVCKECGQKVRDGFFEKFPFSPEDFGQPVDPETLGEGKGPDFRALPTTPPRVKS